jgi:hypothetical protein
MAHTGEMAQVELQLAKAAVPQYLTGDGAVNWQPAAVYDPVLDQTVAVAVKGSPPPAANRTRLVSAAVASSTANLAPGEPLVFAAGGRTPNFVARAVTTDRAYFDGSQPVVAAVAVANQGLAWAKGDGEALAVTATWDGAPGEGAPAGEVWLNALGEGEQVIAAISLSPPPRPDDAHVLYITVNPGLRLAEQTGGDNAVTLPFGALTAPAGLHGTASGAGEHLTLEWRAVDDSRVAGYRVYRLDANGIPSPAGTTGVAGWLDTDVTFNSTYRYQVTAFTAGFVESAPSESLEITMPAPSPDRQQGSALFLPSVRR